MRTVLIGNKCDIKGKREVNSEIAEALAVANGFKYFETSAKENINLDQAFYEMAKDIYTEVEFNSCPLKLICVKLNETLASSCDLTLV